MITRFDKLQMELPHPDHPSPNSAAAVQELLGGKFGEMSTFMNYTFQSFNFRGRSEMRPFYDLIANIAAEEFGHIELVSYAINLLLTGTTERGDDPAETPLASAADARNTYHFLASGQQALPMDSQGNFWTGANVFSSGNLKLDLLHNFFLECGARASKIRVYETVDDPTARACVGFLLVRGGVHIVAYAKALEKLSGVEVGKLLPIPDISNKRFPEAARSTRPVGCTGSSTSSVPRTIRWPATSGMASIPKTAATSRSRLVHPRGSSRRIWTPSRSSPHRWARTSTRRCSPRWRASCFRR